MSNSVMPPGFSEEGEEVSVEVRLYFLGGGGVITAK